jgi:hypothetical protein
MHSYPWLRTSLVLVVLTVGLVLSEGMVGDSFAAWHVSDSNNSNTFATTGWDSFSAANPGGEIAGTSFNETITAILPSGATDTTYTGSKTVTFSGPSTSPSGKAPSYPTSVTFHSGVGTASVTLYDAQTTTLTATQGIIAGTSTSFTVKAGGASNLVFTTQPGSSTSGEASIIQPVVAVEDVSGNTVTSGSSSNASVTLTVNSQPGSGATLSCTSNPVTATGGIATFSGCQIVGTGGSYTINATASGPSEAISSSFSILSLVQQNSITPAASATSVTPTLSTGITAGDALILVIGDQSSNSAIVSSVSGGGVTWAKATSTGSTTNGDAEIWYGLNSSGTSGSTVITVTVSGSTNVQIADVSEWSGVATSSALDKSAHANGSSASISAGSVTPSQSGELIVSDAYLAYLNSSTVTPTNGFTSLTELPGQTGYYRGYGAYLGDATATSISTTWTEPGSGSWSAAIASFKP